PGKSAFLFVDTKSMRLRFSYYQPPAMWHAFGSFGGHMGTGIALFFATATVVLVEAEEIWVEAAAPVRARTTTKARTMFFIWITTKNFLFVDAKLMRLRLA